MSHIGKTLLLQIAALGLKQMLVPWTLTHSVLNYYLTLNHVINDTTQQLLEPDQYYAPTGKKIPQKIIKKDSSPIALADYSNKLQTLKNKVNIPKNTMPKISARRQIPWCQVWGWIRIFLATIKPMKKFLTIVFSSWFPIKSCKIERTFLCHVSVERVMSLVTSICTE